MNPQQTKDAKGESVFTAKQVEEHINQEDAVQFIQLGELLRDREESCVDGRAQVGIIGVPGGNMGEFILALSTVEKISGKKINLKNIDQILAGYCEVFGKFYMHTDDHALEHLSEELAKDDTFAQINKTIADMESLAGLIMNPQENVQDALLEHLVKPANVGCGHIKLILKHPKEYGVRKELVEECIKAFFRSLWSGNQMLTYIVLEGGHEEVAVVNIRVETNNINKNTAIPTITPLVGGEQIFINHPQAAEFMRTHESKRIARVTGMDVDEERYKREIVNLGNKQLRETLKHLAHDLPVFNVIFKQGAGEFDFSVIKK